MYVVKIESGQKSLTKLTNDGKDIIDFITIAVKYPFLEPFYSFVCNMKFQDVLRYEHYPYKQDPIVITVRCLMDQDALKYFDESRKDELHV